MARSNSAVESLPGLWRIIRHFWPYLRKQRKLIALSFLALFAQVGFRLLEPWPLKFVFDQVIAPSVDGASGDTVGGFLAGNASMILLLSAVAVVAIAGFRALSAYGSTVGFALVGNRVLTRVRSDLYEHLQKLSLAYHSRTRGGDITVRVVSDVGMLKDVTVTALLPMLGNILILVGMLSVMFFLHWKLTLLGLAVFPLFWLRTISLSREIQKVSRRQRDREGAIASTAAESISSIKIVQALSLENVFTGVFSADNDRSMKEGVKAKRLEASLERSVDVLIALATALVLWYGATLTMRGELSAGDLLVFLTYLKSAFKPVRDFAKYTGRISKAVAAGERVLSVFQEVPDVRDRSGAVPAPSFTGAVSFNNVRFSYDDATTVLDDINLDVAPGQRVALVGPSGNGKSTMINLILRLYDPTAGSVTIDGQDIRRFTVDSLRSQISVVLQDNILFAASVRDNIAYGATDATLEEIEAAARVANAHEFILAMPDGYDTVISERGVTLSNGQRQRMAIARAAIRRGPILLLDEATTGLDEANEQAVNDALHRLAQGRTTFLVTHDLSMAATADLIVYVERGRLVEQGTHTELMKLGGRYAAMYHLQATTLDHDTDRQSHERHVHAFSS
jgi:ATP-binding cassette, subfamily B, bacterial